MAARSLPNMACARGFCHPSERSSSAASKAPSSIIAAAPASLRAQTSFAPTCPAIRPARQWADGAALLQNRVRRWEACGLQNMATGQRAVGRIARISARVPTRSAWAVGRSGRARRIRFGLRNLPQTARRAKMPPRAVKPDQGSGVFRFTLSGDKEVNWLCCQSGAIQSGFLGEISLLSGIFAGKFTKTCHAKAFSAHLL